MYVVGALDAVQKVRGDVASINSLCVKIRITISKKIRKNKRHYCSYCSFPAVLF